MGMVTTVDLAWAVGFLEGEGFLYSRKDSGTMILAANQVERWPLDRLLRIFGGRISARGTQNPRWQPQWKWEICGPRAVGILFTLYCDLSPKRQAQIREALRRWRTFPAHASVRNNCVNGHVYTKKSTRMVVMFGKLARRCRICATASHRRWVEKKRRAS